MPKYLEVAAEANKTAKQLYELIEKALGDKPNEEVLGEAACLMARLVNYGLRCCPRPPQSTVRLNAVKESVKGLPVYVDMETKEGSNGRTYNALITTPKLGGK